MIVQFFNKIASVVTLYSIITALACLIVPNRNASVAKSHKLLPWLRALNGFLGSYIILVICKVILPTTALKLPFFLGLPTLCGLFYWSWESKVIRIGIAAICVIFFIVHPVGFYAAPYALFWLIPMLIALLPQHALLMAFGSTFTAHAVGSVMHLYVFNTLSAQAWIALMPVVVFERTILALSTWAGYALAYKISEIYKDMYYSKAHACK